LPAVETIILARACGTVSSFLQACGRGLRPSPETGKRRCLVLDLTGAAILHGLPDDERVWSLEGAPRRVGKALAPLARCQACFAVFHAQATCPRCGERVVRTLPRRHTRIERAELARLDTRPQYELDGAAVRAIERRLFASGRFPNWRVSVIARGIFERQRKRAPEVAS